MPRRASIWLAALAVALAAPAGAQDGRPIAFSVHGSAFTVPTPAGYCTQTEAQAAISKQVHAWDTINLTPLEISRCGMVEATDYMLIKTPREASRIPMARADFINLMKDQFSADLIKEGIAKGSEDVSKGSDGTITMGDGDFGYRGHDDICIYLGGSLDVTGEGGKRTGRIGTCVTLVGGYLMTINAYDFAPNGSDEAALMARSRAMAVSISAS